MNAVDRPESSVDSRWADPGGIPSRSRFAKRSESERRDRRREVAALLLDGWAAEDIEREVAARHRVTDRTIRSDIRFTYRGWGAADASATQARRTSLARRLDRIARKAEAEGRYRDAIAAAVASGALFGVLPPDAESAAQLARATGRDPARTA